MPARTLHALANLLQAARQKKPYVLLLASGLSLTPALLQAIDRPSWEGFYDLMREYSKEECAYLLQEHFATLHLHEGYRYLARLIHEGYFRAVLTTNVDSFLSDALDTIANTSKDITMLIRGKDEDDAIANALRHPAPVTICLLRGQNNYYPFVTLAEIRRFSPTLEPIIKSYLEADILVLGLTQRSDLDILACISSKGGSIWYITPELDQRTLDYLPARRYRGRVITGPEAHFNTFFRSLAEILHASQSPLVLKTIKVFYLSAPADKGLQQEIEARLGQYSAEAHEKWVIETEQSWQAARVILLLVSEHLDNYDRVREAMERHTTKAAIVIPILLRPVDWRGAMFAQLDILPQNQQAITSWLDRDQALSEVARGILSTIKNNA